MTFTPENPGDGRYGGEELVKGVLFVTTDRERMTDGRRGCALVEIRRPHPDRLEG